MYKLRLGLVIFASLVLFLAGCANNKVNVVASVNGTEITRQELDKRVNLTIEGYKQQGLDLTSKENKALKDQVEKGVLDELIAMTLLMQEAEKQNLTASKEEVDKNLAEIKESFGSEEEFKKALQEAKWTEEDVREDIEFRLTYQNLFNKVTADVAKPNEAEINEYYEQHKDMFGTREKLEVKHMLFAVDGSVPDIPKRTDEEALQAAKLALAEVTQKGRDFAAVAREKSDDLGTRENGGAYTIEKGAGTTDPAFEEAAAALKPGEITKEPVKSQYGYHLIKLEDIKPATQRSLDEVKESIASQLESENQQVKFSQFMDDIEKEAKIDNKLAPETGDSAKK
ncbi:SurA N-terminal domain-containing protein [Desulforamulus aquiferis]|uniref:peptidylprolyl isomerase n=1 Tax=Desulforamulus aquiferis TaxID=1397668 RepID=A0AAW7ZFJ3_9FIRM|nr:peptidyl-prolyl cis-trans isomerase [Desulforamulus aquiferis]MDO7788047.1 SurA N-terminal domain-containing protein [Desulforamulus aquiferis]